jgi:hypothetical protein
MLPDPAFYADCLRESYAELMRAIDAIERGARARAPRASGASRTAKSPPAGKRPVAGAARKAARRKAAAATG